METNDKRNEVVLDEAARIIKLDSSNSSFKMNNGFLTLTTTCGGEEKHYQRVFLHRDFPHELLWEYISVIGEDGREIGLIYNVIMVFSYHRTVCRYLNYIKTIDFTEFILFC